MANIKDGDIGTDIIFTIHDETGQVVDLTGATIRYLFRREGGTTLDVPGTIVSPPGTDGKVRYTLDAGILLSAGGWSVQVKTSLPGGKVFYTDQYEFQVDPVIPPP